MRRLIIKTREQNNNIALVAILLDNTLNGAANIIISPVSVLFHLGIGLYLVMRPAP